jgi:cation diffusion facilitator CzcD-associated flavoprotein CzcO
MYLETLVIDEALHVSRYTNPEDARVHIIGNGGTACSLLPHCGKGSAGEKNEQ